MEKVKLFYAILFNDTDILEKAKELLIKKWEAIDFVSKPFPFDGTSYYEEEMGKDLSRIFVSFDELQAPSILPESKNVATEIENVFAIDGKRKINLDPGYLDYAKLVLVSGKYAPHKLWIADGMYADFTLIYSKGKYQKFNWTFPDFAKGIYDSSLLKIRDLYKKKVNKSAVK